MGSERMKIFFIVFIIHVVFALICTIYLFFQFGTNREIRQRKTNLVLIILLFVTFLQVKIIDKNRFLNLFSIK